MGTEHITFWRHTWLEITCAFADFKIVRDVLIGTGAAVMTLGLQVWKHVISVSDWQEHKEWWVLSFVLPYLAVLVFDAVWRLAQSPWMLYRKTAQQHSEELSRVKAQHEQELADARKQNQFSQRLVIRSAKYGTGDVNDVSVLDAVNLIPRDALAIPVDNNLVAGGPDPAPMQRKRLHIEYSYGE